MSNLVFNNLQVFQENQYKSSVYILLINADKTPPHLAVLDNGMYYSLGVNGLRMVPFDSFKSYQDNIYIHQVLNFELSIPGYHLLLLQKMNNHKARKLMNFHTEGHNQLVSDRVNYF